MQLKCALSVEALLKKTTMSVQVANEIRANKPISKQLVELLGKNPKLLEGLSFGNITIEIKQGNIYRVLISNSVLVKPNEGGV